jgi:predicted alpha/beta-fold hydrolase
VLVHGVCGSHLSPYCVRVARKLNAVGVRTFRLDLRGCGAGQPVARQSYHGGCSGDLCAAVRWIAEQCPGSPLTVVAFSLGGNIALKMLGEPRRDLPEAIDLAAVISPPICLIEASRRMSCGVGRYYNRYLAKLLYRQLLLRRQVQPDLRDAVFAKPPRTVWEFDDVFTAPLAGFGTAENYYRQCSAAPLLENVRVPTLILTAADDPLVPPEPFQSTPLSPAITLRLTPCGGHLGFLSRPNGDPDRHWMDWRILDWMAAFS